MKTPVIVRDRTVHEMIAQQNVDHRQSGFGIFGWNFCFELQTFEVQAQDFWLNIFQGSRSVENFQGPREFPESMELRQFASVNSLVH